MAKVKKQQKNNDKKDKTENAVRRFKSKYVYYDLHPSVFIASVLSELIQKITGLYRIGDLQDAQKELQSAIIKSNRLISELTFNVCCPTCGKKWLIAYMHDGDAIVNATISYIFTRCIADDGSTIKPCDLEELREMIGNGKIRLPFSYYCSKCEIDREGNLRKIEHGLT